MLNPQKNDLFKLAENFVSRTAATIFLTGKAGTGKTTFLRQIVRSGIKQCVIAAPTGVAAINAGGVTLHSLFQLPFGIYLPDHINNDLANTEKFYNRNTLFKNAKLNDIKRKLLRKMELLIIDEISMVKADTMDAINELLQNVRKNELPFGGVQLLCIGDLLQLPPVITDEEWETMRYYYASPFFFEANVFRNNDPITIEFDTIYRQENLEFISLLNNIRNNSATPEELEVLNKNYYKPDFEPAYGEKYITLCSHNFKADRINELQLNQLSTNLHEFDAEIEGSFFESSYPTQKTLQLKKGAQIMFIRNDASGEKKYFNGKIGLIESIDEDSITISFENEPEELTIKKDVWENVRFSVDDVNGKIKEDVIGKFKQFPIKLAWAVTIHKSQGLTFDKAIIDAGSSFSEGQVYVALSRLTGPEGLILATPINNNAIKSNPTVLKFMDNTPSQKELLDRLSYEEKKYIHSLLMLSFDFSLFAETLSNFRIEIAGIKAPMKEKLEQKARKWVLVGEELEEVAQKFKSPLKNLIEEAPSDNYKHLTERLEAAQKYFAEKINLGITQSLEEYFELIKKEPLTKKFKNTFNKVYDLVSEKSIIISNSVKMAKALQLQISSQDILSQFKNNVQVDKSENKFTQKVTEKVLKPEKGESQRLSLELFKEGKSIEEVAQIREKAISTIEGHLAGFVLTGQLSVFDLIDKESVEEIYELIDKKWLLNSGQLREELKDKYTFTQLRFVINHWKNANPEKASTLKSVYTKN
jgi:hypothetical protein